MPKLKKEIYKFTEVGAMLYDMFPGHYLNLKSAIATVNTNARALKIADINGKKKHRHMTAKDAERVLIFCERTMREFTATPIEKAIRDADEAAQPSEAPAAPVVETVINKITADAPVLSPKTATEKKAEADAFETLRKKFYTDVNYFIKFAQSAEERLAIWNALANLYGIEKAARIFNTYDKAAGGKV